MVTLKLLKDVSKRGKVENKEKKREKKCLRILQLHVNSKDVLSLLINRGRKQDKRGQESGDKVTGSRKAGNVWEAGGSDSLSPPAQIIALVYCLMSRV